MTYRKQADMPDYTDPPIPWRTRLYRWSNTVSEGYFAIGFVIFIVTVMFAGAAGYNHTDTAKAERAVRDAHAAEEAKCKAMRDVPLRDVPAKCLEFFR